MYNDKIKFNSVFEVCLTDLCQKSIKNMSKMTDFEMRNLCGENRKFPWVDKIKF